MKYPHGFWIIGLALGMSAVSAAEKSAETAWAGLVGDLGERAAFAYVENDATLPNVLIYGDSISIGYTPGVRTALKGRANVYRVHLNGGPSGSFIGKFDTMESTMRAPDMAGHWDFAWDIVHVNVGLHDLKYVNERGKLDLEAGRQVATIAEYQANLRRIIAHLRNAAPKAKLIFALTTKVPPESNGRHENAERAYNDAAMAVLKDFPEIGINDLRTASLPYEQPGNVHFKPAGIAAQAEHVANVIATCLR
ncbi:MAG: SGNH/GDSL hydrolase family protein [Opitutaceae bacterium]|nr:SGNH/GDSL hydrolase family protein [Opitutaceae bacterium]